MNLTHALVVTPPKLFNGAIMNRRKFFSVVAAIAAAPALRQAKPTPQINLALNQYLKDEAKKRLRKKWILMKLQSRGVLPDGVFIDA